jgi:hypothetical protein
MTEQFKLNLSRIWLLASITTLILPVFLPSFPNPQNFLQNVIGTATVTMFILSFPGSLFGIPIFFFVRTALGVDSNAIGGMYLNLILLFLLGLVQWFWVVPRLLGGKSDLDVLNLQEHRSTPLLSEMQDGEFGFYDRESRTPLERVLNEKETK